MIFFIPLLFLVFILLLVLRLAGGHVTWDDVLIPIIVLGVLIIVFIAMGIGRRKK